MNKAEQIAQILGIPSTDVTVTNNSEARLKDRELTEAEQELIADVFLSEDKKEIKALKAEMIEPAEKAFILERKIQRFVETDDKNVLIEPEPEIEYENGIEVFRGQVISEDGEKWIVNLNSFITQEDWRPSTLHAQGNRTLWRKKQPDIPEEDLCAETPEWNSANWNDYSVGYKVKSGNAIWEATNTTHTWIEPAHEGDGAISWKHIKDCE